MKINNIEVFNFEGAIRGLRNPLESWAKSDSHWGDLTNEDYIIGDNDLDLMKRLYKAGTEHRKYLRQIMVCFDLTAPLYVFKELDTYKVGTTANSTSTMHKIQSNPITLECFEIDDLDDMEYYHMGKVIETCEFYRNKYLETKDKKYWKALIRILPESWLQTRTITMNYENVINIIKQREHHKLTEWHYIVDELKKLPYIEEIMNEEG